MVKIVLFSYILIHGMNYHQDYRFLDKDLLSFEIFWLLVVFFLMETTLNALSKKVCETSKSKNIDCHSHKYTGADESSFEQALGRFI